MEVKKFRLTKIEKRPLLYLILTAQASNFYHGFYNVLYMFSPNIKTLSQQYVFFLNQKVWSVSRMPFSACGVERVKVANSLFLSILLKYRNRCGKIKILSEVL